MNCYIDGSCGPKNPGGSMGIGFYYDGHKGSFVIEACPTNTNNVAEYIALQTILVHLQDIGVTDAVIYSDSKLVVNQMNKKWRIGRGTYAFYAEICKRLLSESEHRIKWIPREENTLADELSKRR